MKKSKKNKDDLCPRCDACEMGYIPQFATDEEEENFWDHHKPSRFRHLFQPVQFTMSGGPVQPVERREKTIVRPQSRTPAQ